MSSAWSSHLGMSGFLAEASAALARTRTRTRRGIVHLRTLARRELSFTLVVTRSTTREVDARSGGVQPLSRWAALLRPPWNAACADVQPLTSKEQTVVSCGSPCTRKDCFRAAEPEA